MTAIDRVLMEKVTEFVARRDGDAEWHTVTVTLNGQHGGADVRLEGIDWGYDRGEVTREGTIH